MARQLQKAAVRLLSEQTCRRFYPVQISSRMLCAGFPQGGVDSCSVSAAPAPVLRAPTTWLSLRTSHSRVLGTRRGGQSTGCSRVTLCSQ
jgi:hypothetical protein